MFNVSDSVSYFMSFLVEIGDKLSADCEKFRKFTRNFLEIARRSIV